ncbi:MAG: ABC1 kinase family protein [Solirubrobacteraceae bacterium]
MLGRAKHVGHVLGQVAREEAAATLVRQARRRSRQGESDETERSASRARAVRRALEELGPFYIKIGQMLSTRPDICPDYMMEEFKNLHAEVTVAPFETFEPVLESELGRNWRKMFKTIETEKPLGAASLAQVYRVTLRSGKPAVVKIQRPGVAAVMRDDMALLRRLSKMLAKRAPDFNDVFDIEAMLGAVFDGMEPELDFTIEADNMLDAKDLIEPFDLLAVPDVIHVTERVLVQSLAAGRSIREVNRDAFSREEREEIGRQLLGLMLRGMVVDRVFHADPHPGNVFVEPGKPATIIDWGMCGKLDRRMSLGLVMIFLNLSQNDGAGTAKAWIEIGRATKRANIPAFINDMSSFVPSLVGASLETLDFGVALTSVLKFSSKRGIQTPPAISLIGKALANIEGSVRYLAPELEVMGVFEDEFKDLAFDLVAEAASEQTAAKLVLESIVAVSSVPEQARSLLRDVANREFAVRVSAPPPPVISDESFNRLVLLVAAAGIWYSRQQRRPAGAL